MQRETTAGEMSDAVPGRDCEIMTTSQYPEGPHHWGASVNPLEIHGRRCYCHLDVCF